MTSLQLTLLIVAVVAIAVVVIYNFVQRRKVDQRVERSRAGMAAAVGEANAKESLRDRNEPVLERFTMPGPDAAQGESRGQAQALSAGDVNAFSPNQGADGANGATDDTNGSNKFNPLQVGPGSNANQGAVASSSSETNNPADAVNGYAVKADSAKGDSAKSDSAKGDAWMLRTYGLNPVADCIVNLPLRDPISGERLLSLTSSIRRVGSKPIIFEGQNDLGEWDPIVAGERFVSLRAGVLMANRHGALNAMEFSDFSTYLEKLALHFEIHANVPDMQTTLQRARALDAQCADLDAQIGLNIISAEALSTSDLAAVASEFGLLERGNNRYSLMGEHQEALFSLALGDAPNRLSLLLDVPRAPSASNPWARMLDCAQRCVARFGGRLVDDADKPLNKEALDRISSQLAQRYQSLSEASMVAGSPVALRLFN